jgi:hypothetical protein
MDLPDRFQLALEVWGDRALIARCRVLGQHLGPSVPDPAPGSPAESEAWHQVRVDRGLRGLSLSVDGRTVPADPGPDGLTSRLTVEPPSDRPVLFRDLSLSWTAASGAGK